MYNYLWTLAYVIILNFICVIIAFVLWYHMWVKNLGGNLLFSVLNFALQLRYRLRKMWSD